jgi:hypothetical protein
LVLVDVLPVVFSPVKIFGLVCGERTRQRPTSEVEAEPQARFQLQFALMETIQLRIPFPGMATELLVSEETEMLQSQVPFPGMGLVLAVSEKMGTLQTLILFP